MYPSLDRLDEFPSITGLKARYSAQDSFITTARDGTGAKATNGGLVGRVSDLSGNGYYATCSADGARPDWYANGFGLGRSSIFSQTAGEDLFNNTTLAADVFSGTNPSWTYIVMYARWLETPGSNQHIFGVLKNGGTIGVGAGNPAFTITPNNGVYVDLRPLIASGYATDAMVGLGGGQAFDDDPAFGIGYGSSSIICLSRVENVRNSKVYQNGHLVSNVATKTSGDYTFASGDYVGFLKAFNGTTRTGAIDGHLYEWCVFNKALSDSERQAVEEHYLRKLNVGYSRTTVATPKKLWFFGHSMFIGAANVDAASYGGFAPAPFLLATADYVPWEYKIAIVNESVSGQYFSLAGASNDSVEVLAAKKTTATNMKATDIAISRAPTNDTQADDSSNAAMETELDARFTTFKTFITDQLAEVAFFIHVCDPLTGSGTLTTDVLTAGQMSARRHGLAYWRDLVLPWLGRYHRCTMSDSYAGLDNGDTTLVSWANSGDGVHLSLAGYKYETSILGRAIRHHDAFNPATFSGAIGWWGGGEQSTALADADAISPVEDFAGSVDASEATNPPKFKVGTSATNYKAYVLFDGTNDQLSLTEQVLTAYTLVYSTTGMAYATNNPLLSDNGGNSILRLPSSTTTVLIDTAGATITFTHAARADGDVEMITSDGKHYLNGVLSTSSGTVAATFTFDRIGVAGAAFFGGGIINLWGCTSVVSAANRKLCGEYFAYKTGKTWTT